MIVSCRGLGSAGVGTRDHRDARFGGSFLTNKARPAVGSFVQNQVADSPALAVQRNQHSPARNGNGHCAGAFKLRKKIDPAYQSVAACVMQSGILDVYRNAVLVTADKLLGRVTHADTGGVGNHEN